MIALVKVFKKHLHLDLENFPGCFLFKSRPKHFNLLRPNGKNSKAIPCGNAEKCGNLLICKRNSLLDKHDIGATSPGWMTQRLKGGGMGTRSAEEEEESEGLAGAPSHSEGQQKHLWPSPQNLINHSAPTDPDCGDLCTYKHLCLQFSVKKKQNPPHTHQRIYCFCCLADLLNSPFLFSLAQAHNRSRRGGLFGPRHVFFFFLLLSLSADWPEPLILLLMKADGQIIFAYCA